MNATVLIDAIVRQTTVLLAQLATGTAGRATLAHTAGEVFANLVKELKAQGVSNKGIADMFGLTLRTYHNKVSRLGESSTERGHSLWEASLKYVQDSGSVTRAQVLERFAADDESVVRGVLRELVDAGLLFRSGHGDGTFYRAAGPDEIPEGAIDTTERLAAMLWVAIKRFGPLTRAALSEVVPAGQRETTDALARLLADGRVEQRPSDDGPTFFSEEFVIAATDPAGWEAAVFDHFQALVTTVATNLRLRGSKLAPREWVGGTTHSYEVWREHPHFEEVLEFLESTRKLARSLRRRVETYNRQAGLPETGLLRVVVYAGQTVLGLEDESED